MKYLSELKVIVAGICVMVIVCVVLAAICSGTVLWGWIPGGSLRVVGAVVTFLAAMTGGWFVAGCASGGPLPKALATAAGYLAIVFILRGLVFRTVGEGVWLPALTAVLGAAAGAFLTAGKGKKRRRR